MLVVTTGTTFDLRSPTAPDGFSSRCQPQGCTKHSSRDRPPPRSQGRDCRSSPRRPRNSSVPPRGRTQNDGFASFDGPSSYFTPRAGSLKATDQRSPFLPSPKGFLFSGWCRERTGARAGGQSKPAGSGLRTQAGHQGSRIVSHDHGRPQAFAPWCPSSATSSPARAGVSVAAGPGRGRTPGPGPAATSPQRAKKRVSSNTSPLRSR